MKNKKKDKINFNNVILQEYINSEYLYVAHILCNNGVIVMSKIYYKQNPEKYYISKGSIIDYNTRDINCDEYDIFSKILKLNNYHGVCCIDYTIDSNNKIKIFEINPRFGGSLIENEKDLNLFILTMIEHNITYG